MKTKINVFTENIADDFAINERKFIAIAKKILRFYLSVIFDKSCLLGYDFDVISFDILYCTKDKTLDINRQYRAKDYPADIITFAIFADSEEKFVFDREINLGEIIIAIDKVYEEAAKKNTSFEHELAFLIGHGILHLLGFDHSVLEDYNFVVELQNKALEGIGV